jgi:hypothetical protein
VKRAATSSSVEQRGAGANEQANSYKRFFGSFFVVKKGTTGNVHPYIYAI